ncbi:hypothetical protein CHGG_10024 [Chaetomium globosum CBS 148.51]|uniref:Putative hetero-Diels-Alderase ccdI n=1 Tax=Chaetomium globosum (strain ATCC 6205 / CBS 148.51 / DSM 1962 / NBRC 6347 / NRRL 1970) TaxID=306901 RepID=CCDI_CHAGB|nr:uncharacterized protein CHGG_10024 [Chaetomium globosum CBS 148.51]EAQ83620.1 hypothetical protein CHGG_10024 [Chaetomium globosum CBS 148.51]
MGPRTRDLLFCAAVSAVAVAAASCAAPCSSSADLPLPVRTVYQFDSETWIENLAVRPNGDLLLIVDENVTFPEHTVALYRLSNPVSPEPELSLVYAFPLGTVLGIAEIEPEVYAVLASNFTGNFAAIPGTAKLFTFDYNNGDQPTMIWAVNITTGATTIFAQVPEMAQVRNQTNMGINGLRVFRGHLYFTNSDLRSVYRVPLDGCGSGGKPRIPG